VQSPSHRRADGAGRSEHDRARRRRGTTHNLRHTLPHSQTKFIPGWNAVGRHFSRNPFRDNRLKQFLKRPVLFCGLGSLGGAALGAVLVGLVRCATVRYWAEAELFSIYGVMAVVLIARPKGLFAAQEARKI